MKKKETDKRLLVLYIVATVALITLMAIILLWFNDETPKLFDDWHFKF